jgi:hypothetical protein
MERITGKNVISATLVNAMIIPITAMIIPTIAASVSPAPLRAIF